MRSSPDSPDLSLGTGAQSAPVAPRQAGKYGRRVQKTQVQPQPPDTGPVPDPVHDNAYDTLAGTIVSAHGVQGTLKVKPATETATSLFVPEGNRKVPVWIGPSRETGAVRQIVSAKRQEPKNIYLVHVETVNDRTAAETLIGQSLFAPGARRVPLAEAEYFVSDLVGLDVLDEKGVSLGTLTDVHRSPAHDIYETDQEILIPAVREFVARVDLAAGQLVVHDADRLKIMDTVERGDAAAGEE